MFWAYAQSELRLAVAECHVYGVDEASEAETIEEVVNSVGAKIKLILYGPQMTSEYLNYTVALQVLS